MVHFISLTRTTFRRKCALHILMVTSMNQLHHHWRHSSELYSTSYSISSFGYEVLICNAKFILWLYKYIRVKELCPCRAFYENNVQSCSDAAWLCICNASFAHLVNQTFVLIAWFCLMPYPAMSIHLSHWFDAMWYLYNRNALHTNYEH